MKRFLCYWRFDGYPGSSPLCSVIAESDESAVRMLSRDLFDRLPRALWASVIFIVEDVPFDLPLGDVLEPEDLRD